MHEHVEVAFFSCFSNHARGEFVFQLDVKLSFSVQYGKNIKEVAGIKANGDWLIFIFCFNLFHRFAEIWIIGRDRNLAVDRKSTRLNSSHITISYAVFCLKKKKKKTKHSTT